MQTPLMPTVTANGLLWLGGWWQGRGGFQAGALALTWAPGSRHLFPAAHSARPPSPSSLPGDQPRRGAPGAERLPQEARLRAGHLRRLPGGGRGARRELLWGRRGGRGRPSPSRPLPPGVPQVLRVRVHGASLPVPGRGLLPLRAHAEGADRASAPGAHREADLRSR